MSGARYPFSPKRSLSSLPSSQFPVPNTNRSIKFTSSSHSPSSPTISHFLLSMATHAAFLGSALPTPTLGTPFRRSHRFTIRAEVDPSDKSVEIMRKFSEQYARKSGTYFCVDKGVTAVVIKGLADHKDSLGAPLCPCRHYDDKAAEAGQGFWNCPCVPMRERKECHCMLFLTPDNDFAGQEQKITLDEIKESTSKI